MKPSTWTLIGGLIFAAITAYLIFQFEPVWWSIVTTILTAVAAVVFLWRGINERRAESSAQASSEGAPEEGA